MLFCVCVCFFCCCCFAFFFGGGGGGGAGFFLYLFHYFFQLFEIEEKIETVPCGHTRPVSCLF